ncbi:hypothetical protein PR048_027951 [Dryococelus australis]|uniref:Uncharacterized protein n=1 Tax=Dryococelus australis TaxID=614101 RepID=A0ABQ9GHZ0_9NEOP|nr:hypothetical protein PR048_027951 [Dryococelus australis]
MQGREKQECSRENPPANCNVPLVSHMLKSGKYLEKIQRRTAAFTTFSQCESQVLNQPGIEQGSSKWETGVSETQLLQPFLCFTLLAAVQYGRGCSSLGACNVFQQKCPNHTTRHHGIFVTVVQRIRETGTLGIQHEEHDLLWRWNEGIGPPASSVNGRHCSSGRQGSVQSECINCEHARSLFASHKGEPGSIPGRVTPDFRIWQSCQTMPFVGGFPRDLPFQPAFSFPRCSILTSITPLSLKTSLGTVVLKRHANLVREPHTREEIRSCKLQESAVHVPSNSLRHQVRPNEMINNNAHLYVYKKSVLVGCDDGYMRIGVVPHVTVPAAHHTLERGTPIPCAMARVLVDGFPSTTFSTSSTFGVRAILGLPDPPRALNMPVSQSL